MGTEATKTSRSDKALAAKVKDLAKPPVKDLDKLMAELQQLRAQLQKVEAGRRSH